MAPLNGWQRIGVLLSAAWLISVSAYAVYELVTFPFDDSDAVRFEPPYEPSGFVFVGIVSTPWKERQPLAAALMKQHIEEAKTEKEKQSLLSALNSTEYRSSLLPVFYLVLFGGPLFFWLAAYAGLYITRWVRAGFQKQ